MGITTKSKLFVVKKNCSLSYWKTSRYAINMQPRYRKGLIVIYYTSNKGINRVVVN